MKLPYVHTRKYKHKIHVNDWVEFCINRIDNHVYKVIDIIPETGTTETYFILKHFPIPVPATWVSRCHDPEHIIVARNHTPLNLDPEKLAEDKYA